MGVIGVVHAWGWEKFHTVPNLSNQRTAHARNDKRGLLAPLVAQALKAFRHKPEAPGWWRSAHHSREVTQRPAFPLSEVKGGAL